MFDYSKKTNFNKRTFLIILCVLVSCVVSEAASPKKDIKQGNRYYQDGEYAASREKYVEALEKVPESDIVNFNLGTAFYKEEDYEKAADHLQNALLSDDEELKRNAHYNLGNALYQSGMAHAQDDIELAVSSLEKSLSQYKRVLSIDEDDKDSKHNYEFVQRELLRLKEIQKQQQKQCDLPKDKKDQKPEDQQSQEEKEKQQQQQQQQQEGQQEQQQQEQQGGREEEQQGQSGQEEQSEEQQEKQDQERGQETEEDYNKQQEAGTQPQNAQELTQKEAQMLLESYQQTEEPQGLLKVYPKTSDTRPVFKDW